LYVFAFVHLLHPPYLFAVLRTMCSFLSYVPYELRHDGYRAPCFVLIVLTSLGLVGPTCFVREERERGPRERALQAKTFPTTSTHQCPEPGVSSDMTIIRFLLPMSLASTCQLTTMMTVARFSPHRNAIRLMNSNRALAGSALPLSKGS
jgi:hypothetical protein